ncbi:MAG: CDP-alcohol phosphatidyltransferase family protein, partial [Candidatus Krumholzibacteria bacterium]|nr:CDP-alcohol phosphatidyltransferase family protein [Candidatus Krumholzibacteria bacterium]
MVWSSIGLLLVVSTAVSIFYDTGLGIDIFLWTLLVILVYSAYVLLNITLLRDTRGELKESFQIANILTAVRIFIVAPTMVLLFRDVLLWGALLYCIGALTDLFDGFVARRFRQETVMGVMLDPVGDILITGALFCFFWIRGDVPFWLFGILV